MWLVCGQGARGTCLAEALSQFVHVIDCDTEIYNCCTCGDLNTLHYYLTTAPVHMAVHLIFNLQLVEQVGDVAWLAGSGCLTLLLALFAISIY